MTKMEMFTEIKAVVEEFGTEEQAEFVQNEIKLLEKKRANKKPTKTQEANEKLKAEILTFLAEQDAPVRIAAVMENVEGITSNQKGARLLGDLVKDGKVARTEVKRIAYFEIVAD